MPRQERPREDLMREATALVQRAELQVEGFAEPVIIGFRRDGCGSVFVGSEPVIQFNTKNEFRRGVHEGLLYKAERGRLVSLERRSGKGESVLLRRELDDAQAGELTGMMQTILWTLHQAIRDGRFSICGQVPDDEDVIARIVRWLSGFERGFEIAAAPNAR